jgi:dTDP-4-dehydrorhamnose 3,5-epimerase
MKVTPTELPEVMLIEPQVFADQRGFFLESWNARRFREATGIHLEFVQDNHSRSGHNVLRGLHYQVTRPQGKLVRCTGGRVWHVAVDLRRSSATFKRWVGVELNGDEHRQLWIPPGFAHGFVVQSESADVLYKTTEHWVAEYDRAILWKDPTLGVAWPISGEPRLSAKDAAAPLLNDAELFP